MKRLHKIRTTAAAKKQEFDDSTDTPLFKL